VIHIIIKFSSFASDSEYYVFFSPCEHNILLYNISVGVSKPGVPGPTSKLSPRVPAQIGRRETEREGGKRQPERRRA
jgi:hypothetical protein